MSCVCIRSLLICCIRCIYEVLEETVRELESRLVSEETEKLAAYERETQLISKVTQCHVFLTIITNIG